MHRRYPMCARFGMVSILLAAVAGCQPVAGTGSGTNGGAREITSASGVPMIVIPGGTFVMGTNDGEADEGPAHEVTLSPFVMDKFEVTHEMFANAQLPNPSRWQDDPRKPVERVRWQNAKEYCNERSILEGLEPCYDMTKPGMPCNYEASGYRLPTEAEWEYAARAGSRDVYDFGSPSQLGNYAVFAENSNERTAVVGSKQPNRWGIHDLYGNVSEWCEDVYDANYYASSPTVDPRGPEPPARDELRVMRGGSWKATASMCRATFRQGQRTGDTDACFYTDYCGFRCVRRVAAVE